MSPRARAVAQLALDEQFIEDHEVELALEERQDAKDRLAGVRQGYEAAHERAVAQLAKLELPEGAAARVGRFRIERRSVPARAVSFESKATSRLTIGLVEDDE